MASDAIANASSISIVSSNPREFGKKKRANRSAKLKQSKLDARREQWLSQVVKKKGEANGGGKTVENLEIKPRIEEQNEESMNNYSETGSPSNSITSHTSSVLGSNNSAMNFTSSSSNSSGSWCVSDKEEEEEDEECLDDWEALADALTEADNKQKQSIESNNNNNNNNNINVPESKNEKSGSRAWRPDDVFRPQSLPNLSKNCSVWARAQVPSSCPICCEDLDLTDTSFLPCLCGYRLCLFCHKRILDEDGRCPNCRKHYDYNTPVEQEMNFRFARSCSMGVTRSN